jgi:hypothetical protein
VWRSFHWAVEYDPNREIIGEILEPMRDMRRRKTEITGPDWRNAVFGSIKASAGGDDIDLVALVWRLWSIGWPRCKSDLKVAVQECLG